MYAVYHGFTQMQKYILSLRCACYFIVSQCVKALSILSTPWLNKILEQNPIRYEIRSKFKAFQKKNVLKKVASMNRTDKP